MTTLHNFNADDQAIIEAGYTPQLSRRLGFVSSFAISFSAMSVLMGVFANFGFALSKAGPFGFWTWPLVGFGQLLVVLIFAEMAGRIPLTGAIYNWNSKLANSHVSRLLVWILLFTYFFSQIGIIFAMLGPLQTLCSREFSLGEQRLVGMGIIALQTLINIYGVQFAAYTNKIAVFAEIIVVVLFSGLLLGVVLIGGSTQVDLLTTIPQQPQPYWSGFVLASLMAAWTMLGFEASSDLSEETVNVRVATPKGLISAALMSIMLGSLLLVALTLAIPNVEVVSSSADPISEIIGFQLGEVAKKIFLIFVLLAMFACALMFVAASARVIYAVARDQRIIGSAALIRVSKHKVPVTATLLVAIVETGIFLVAKDATDMFAASTILYYLVYLTTVISFAFGIKKLPPPQSFSLGRWRGMVVTAAIIWLVAEMAILTLPEDFHTAALISLGVVGVGLIFSVPRRFMRLSR